MEKTNKNKSQGQFQYSLINVDDKCLVVKIDFSVSWSNACEIIAMFGLERKAMAEKLIQELNAA